MATFLRSLPPGSPVRSLSKAAATDFLTSQHIVRGIPGDTVALRREWCGAVLWIEAHPLLTLEDITSLSNLQRETLCCLLEVASDGTISQKSRRLYRAIKGPPRDTFLDLMVGTCPELSSLTMAQAQRRLRNVSFNWDPADLAEAREACALREWLLTVCFSVNDLKALPSYLLDRARMVHGVNRQWHLDVVTQSILTMVNVWRSTIVVVRPALPAAAGGGGAGGDGVVANRLAPLGDGGDGGAVHVGVRAGNQQPPPASIIAPGPALANAVPPLAANVAASQQPPMYCGAPPPAGAVPPANHGFFPGALPMGGSVPNPQHHMGPWPGALFQYPPPYGQHPLYYGHQPPQQPPPPPPPLPQYGAAGGSGAGTAAGSAAGPLVSFL